MSLVVQRIVLRGPVDREVVGLVVLVREFYPLRVLDVIDRQGEGAAFVVAQRGDDVVEVVTGVVVLADLTAFLAEFQRDPVLAFLSRSQKPDSRGHRSWCSRS